jgi:serine/threonine protein kinase
VEAVLRNAYSEQSDVWSFGVLLWELYTNALTPFGQYSNTHVLELMERDDLVVSNISSIELKK